MSNEKREEVQEQALTESLQHYRCGLALSMRTGKTKIGLDRLNMEYRSNRKLKALVVAPKLAVFQGWKEDAVKFGYPHLLDHITFSTYLSLDKQDQDYDIIILDECHSLLPSHNDYLSGFKGKILGLTGTPPRYRNSAKYKMVDRYCPIVYSYITNDAVEDNVLNDYRILVHMISLSEVKNVPVKKKDGGVFYNSERSIYNYWSKRVMEAEGAKAKQVSSVMRMKAMMEFPSKIRYARKLMQHIEEKCIVFANTQEQADKLCQHSYHSKNPTSEQNLSLFKAGMIDRLSCVLQLSEGVTVPDLKAAIVLHSYGNERKFMQRFGRCLGLGPDEMATIHLLCFRGTVDETWVFRALEDLDQSKIKYVEFDLEKYETALSR
jgi:superfamily II DNA or RNA helicase